MVNKHILTSSAPVHSCEYTPWCCVRMVDEAGTEPANNKPGYEGMEVMSIKYYIA